MVALVLTELFSPIWLYGIMSTWIIQQLVIPHQQLPQPSPQCQIEAYHKEAIIESIPRPNSATMKISPDQTW